MRAGTVVIACAAATLCARPDPAAADIVHLSTGRTLSVQSHHRDGDWTTLVLRAGGEITCPARLIVKVEADEVVPAEAVATPTTQTHATPVGDGVTRPSNEDLAKRPYAALIAGAARRHQVDARLVHAIISAESNFQPRARSRRGARGLMQLMPATLRRYSSGSPFDPATNIEAGTRHLRALLDQFDLKDALAAYNAGAATVARYGGVPPFAETRAYVARILREVAPPPVPAAATSYP